jgi:crotonobetainyl-CoA:carnitine CoA-transferase CaiB-like acyl-CoA transferase
MMEKLAGMNNDCAEAPLPLRGVRVLDLSTMIAGPYCAAILGEFGADVLKVELPDKGDPCRTFGAMTPAGNSYLWLSEGRNKKSITLDLRKTKGAAILKRLVADCEIVVENFMPGTLEGWGLGYETMKAIRPRLVLVRITAYGQTGPYIARPGYARVAQAFAGLSYLAGEPGRMPVTPGSTSLADYFTGMYGALGALLAYISSIRHGIGQFVDLGLYEGIIRILDEMVPVYAASGFVRERMGGDIPNAVPHGHFRTRDGHWVALACSTDKMWERLNAAMGRPELAAAGVYARTAQRVAAREPINRIVTDFLGGMDRDDAIALCLRYEVPIGPINSIADVFADPQVRERENLIEIETPYDGRIVIPNVVPRLSATPGRIDSTGPTLGEHNDEIYRGRLGLSDAELDEMKRDGVI